jgi:hypothetical protein
LGVEARARAGAVCWRAGWCPGAYETRGEAHVSSSQSAYGVGAGDVP